MKGVSLFVIVLSVLFIQQAKADVRLNSLFQDHMVLQREMEVPIWGWANPGEKIIIKASWGERCKAVAEKDSTWMATLKTPEAGGPFSITISGKNTIVINDILSGEVWLCSGQSNMDFSMSKFVNDSREAKYQPLVEFVREEVASANDPWLRHIEVQQTTSLSEKKTNFKGQWISTTPEQIGKITATGYFFAKELRKHLNVPVGIVECSWGGTRIQPWLSKASYMLDEDMKSYFVKDRKKINDIVSRVSIEDYVDTLFDSKYKAWVESGKSTPRPWPSVHPAKDKQVPSTLYNGMLSSVIPYAIKGVLWYQGESNSHFKEAEYAKYFEKMILSWRAEWQQGDMSFYWTQLAGYQVPDEQSNMGWAMVNDQLRRCLKLPNTGMAVLYDIGEAKDVHPHNKMDAGKRLALWALQKDYQIIIPAVSGPLYVSSEVNNNKIEITFEQVGSGLMVGEKTFLNKATPVNMPLTWFQIAGEDHQWKRAVANIIAPNKIEVLHPDIVHPIVVRYAWSSNPDGANLYNIEGLPAAVFTTEEY